MSVIPATGPTTFTRCDNLPVAISLLQSADLPTSDLTERHCERFFFAGDADSPKGLVGLEVFGDVGLLRSLVVTQLHRRAGTGSSLVRFVENYALSLGVRELYLLTTTAEKFFAARGYTATARDKAPPAILATREFAGICPASSAFMSKHI